MLSGEICICFGYAFMETPLTYLEVPRLFSILRNTKNTMLACDRDIHYYLLHAKMSIRS